MGEIQRVTDHLAANGPDVMRWIPVTERLPEEDGYYLIAIEKERFVGFRRFFAECPAAFTAAMPVSHWMPLPEPPESKEDIRFEDNYGQAAGSRFGA